MKFLDKDYFAIAVTLLLGFSLVSLPAMALEPSWTSARCVKSIELTTKYGEPDSQQGEYVNLVVTYTDLSTSEFFTKTGSGYAFFQLTDFQMALVQNTLNLAISEQRKVQVLGNVYYYWAVGVRLTDQPCS